MTSKQLIFSKEYLKDLNATQAAIRSGYSPGTARSIGHENLTKPDILEYVRKLMKERSQRTSTSIDQVVLGLSGMAFATVTDFVD